MRLSFRSVWLVWAAWATTSLASGLIGGLVVWLAVCQSPSRWPSPLETEASLGQCDEVPPGRLIDLQSGQTAQSTPWLKPAQLGRRQFPGQPTPPAARLANPGQVNPGQVNPGQVNPGQVNPGWANSGATDDFPTNAGPTSPEPPRSNESLPAAAEDAALQNQLAFPQADRAVALKLTSQEKVAIDVYERVNRSVVNINTKSLRQKNVFLFEVPSEGAGSGSVLDQAGHVLTNYHVIEGANKITVTLYDGKSYDAEVVGADPINDIAVIQIDAPAETLMPVHIGDSTKLRVGMQVYAIGNPFGLERTLTTGIISSLNRSLRLRNDRNVKSIIQIDAAINPGSSGGPLLNTGAELIGMNTAIASTTGSSAGVGFAIPAGLIARVVPQLIQHGRVIRADIGIARVYEMERGLLIAQLVPGGPAEQAGLRGPLVVRRRRGPFIYETVDRSAADLIVAVEGIETLTADDFLNQVESHRPGDVVQVTVIRNEREVSVAVRLGTAS